VINVKRAISEEKLRMEFQRSVILYRAVKKRVRYYSLSIEATLFGEYLFMREFGSQKNKKPTRAIKEYYETLDGAIGALKRVLALKTKKGYCELEQ